MFLTLYGWHPSEATTDHLQSEIKTSLRETCSMEVSSRLQLRLRLQLNHIERSALAVTPTRQAWFTCSWNICLFVVVFSEIGFPPLATGQGTQDCGVHVQKWCKSIVSSLHQDHKKPHGPESIREAHSWSLEEHMVNSRYHQQMSSPHNHIWNGKGCLQLVHTAAAKCGMHDHIGERSPHQRVG